MTKDKIILYYNDLVYKPSESFLYKDFGQVPLVLAETHDLHLEYWLNANKPNPGFTSFHGHPVHQFKKSLKLLSDRLDLLKNFHLHRTINVRSDISYFILFPFTPVSDYVVARRIKSKNPRAKIIVKLDANADFLRSIQDDWFKSSDKWWRYLRQSRFYRSLLNIADLIICETDQCREILERQFLGLTLHEKIVQVYSGVNGSLLNSMGVYEQSVSNHRQAIIVSGRISAHQKYSELIFEAGPPPEGWTIEFVGAVDDHFERKISEYRAKIKNFDQHYKFHGVVEDKREYFKILMGARALLMNSRGNEGFPNVFAEAHFCRLFILASDVSGAAEATGNGRYGIIYERESAASLRAALLELPSRIDNLGNEPGLSEHRAKFLWQNSLSQRSINKIFQK
jgi:glycosyltransferase involved in cell wall biosynthesis